jgi:hypothetical protein
MFTLFDLTTLLPKAKEIWDRENPGDRAHKRSPGGLFWVWERTKLLPLKYVEQAAKELNHEITDDFRVNYNIFITQSDRDWFREVIPDDILKETLIRWHEYLEQLVKEDDSILEFRDVQAQIKRIEELLRQKRAAFKPILMVISKSK